MVTHNLFGKTRGWTAVLACRRPSQRWSAVCSGSDLNQLAWMFACTCVSHVKARSLCRCKSAKVKPFTCESESVRWVWDFALLHLHCVASCSALRQLHMFSCLEINFDLRQQSVCGEVLSQHFLPVWKPPTAPVTANALTSFLAGSVYILLVFHVFAPVQGSVVDPGHGCRSGSVHLTCFSLCGYSAHFLIVNGLIIFPTLCDWKDPNLGTMGFMTATPTVHTSRN